MRHSTGADWKNGDPHVDSGAVGQRLGDLFNIENAPAFVIRRAGMWHMAVTEIRSDNPVMGVIDPVPIEDAFLLGLMFRDQEDHEVWEDGRPCPRHSIAAHQFHLRDLNRAQAALIDQPFHSLQFYLPRESLDEISNDTEARRISELRYRPGVPMSDQVVSSLGSCLRVAFERPEQANGLFIEHVTLALAIHICQTYGGLAPGPRALKGGLAAWQERRAKEMLSARLSGEESLAEIAKECALSVRQFSRAFKETTGVAPHQWLLRRRVEVAQAILRSPHISLAEAALMCGFADQSHLTRVFSRLVGITPGAWRRNCATTAEDWQAPAQ
jgi:AraC-like DNA-binding protein